MNQLLNSLDTALTPPSERAIPKHSRTKICCLAWLEPARSTVDKSDQCIEVISFGQACQGRFWLVWAWPANSSLSMPRRQWHFDTGQGLVLKWPAQLPRNKQITGWNAKLLFCSTRPAAQKQVACQQTGSSLQAARVFRLSLQGLGVEFSFCHVRANTRLKPFKTLGPCKRARLLL